MIRSTPQATACRAIEIGSIVFQGVEFPKTRPESRSRLNTTAPGGNLRQSSASHVGPGQV